MVKPGGTGRPAALISARPEPLPPSRSFMERSPSALPLPKKYTYLRAFAARDFGAAAFAAARATGFWARACARAGLPAVALAEAGFGVAFGDFFFAAFLAMSSALLRLGNDF